MIESENMIFAQNDPGARFQRDRMVQFSSIYKTNGPGFGQKFHHARTRNGKKISYFIPKKVILDFSILSSPVFKMAMFTLDMGSHELDVLGKVCFRRPNFCHTFFDVVQKTLRERGILIQIHQMWCLCKKSR